MQSAEENQLPENTKKFMGRMDEEASTAEGLPLDSALSTKKSAQNRGPRQVDCGQDC